MEMARKAFPLGKTLLSPRDTINTTAVDFSLIHDDDDFTDDSPIA